MLYRPTDTNRRQLFQNFGEMYISAGDAFNAEMA